LGRIAGVHGVRGVLKVRAYGESAASLRPGDKVTVTSSGGLADNMSVKWVKPHGRGLLMALDGMVDRGRAARLIGASISIEKSRLPVLEKDAYYWFELLGLNVYKTDGTLLGRLDRIIPTPANDVYVITDTAGPASRELLIPAIGSVVITIDRDRRSMVVDPPEGL
jgi:16S rRNA processing protein RimM